MLDELFRKEVKNVIPFTVASKTVRYLGINLTRGVKRTENHEPC